MVYIDRKHAIKPNKAHGSLLELSLMDKLTSASTFHLLVKIVALIIIMWVAFVRKIPVRNNPATKYKYERVLTTSITIIIALIIIFTLKKRCWFKDDIFFMAICLLIWVYSWKQSSQLDTFLSGDMTNDPTAGDYLLPGPGIDIYGLKGIQAAPNIIDDRAGNLPEHYDYKPFNMPDPATLKRLANLQKRDNRAWPEYQPFNLYSPNTGTELKEENYNIKSDEPNQSPVYKLANEVLVALDDKCMLNQALPDDLKDITEYQRNNGVGQSKWAYIDDNEPIPTELNTMHDAERSC